MPFLGQSVQINGGVPRRLYSTQLTHVDGQGKASMVDVGHKADTQRSATASGRIFVGPVILDMIERNAIKKGDVLTLARISGIMGAKKTAEIIPLCHNIPLNSIKVEATPLRDTDEVEITATVECSGKTGVEMEALVAVTHGLLTIYDMCKAVSQEMEIRQVHLVKKTGGKSDFSRRSL